MLYVESQSLLREASLSQLLEKMPYRIILSDDQSLAVEYYSIILPPPMIVCWILHSITPFPQASQSPPPTTHTHTISTVLFL